MGHKKPGSRADRQSKNLDPVYGTPHRGAPITSDSKKQIRARARRKQKLADADWEKLYDRPIEEWDYEELARGRPRNSKGDFRGRAPNYITRELHEAAMDRFRDMVKGEMSVHTINALKVIDMILTDDSVDDKGRPNTPMSTKLDAAKFLIEHQVGKARQPIEADISVKLQAILGLAMVNPSDSTLPEHLQHFASSPSSRAAITGQRPDLMIVEADEDSTLGEGVG